MLAAPPVPQPELDGAWVTLDARELPLRAHVPRGRGQQRSQAVLRALERAYTTLQSHGWPLPTFDGEYGGSPALDLYVVPSARCAGVAAACQAEAAPLAPSDFDAALTYALISSELPSAELPACTQSALAQAGLHSVDPAESASWVLASAELSVWQLLGVPGCDASFSRGQQLAGLGLLSAAPESGYGGALLLGMLSERLEQRPGAFVQSLWETTRQRSQGLVEAEHLRGSPDLWEVLRLMLETQHLELDDELIEFGVARYFAGPTARKAQAPYRILAALPSDAAVPITSELHSAQLPVKLHEHPPLHDLGSAYVRVRLDERTHQRMQIWLRGELGARWSLTAVRLSESGRELGRVAAPPRKVPSAYLPVTLDAGTAEVVLVVTQLPQRLPDADVHVDTSHGYELIIEVSGA